MFMKAIKAVELTCHSGDSVCSFTLDDMDMEEIEAWSVLCKTLGKKNKVKTIKMMRSVHGLGLREAKYFVDDSINNNFY